MGQGLPDDITRNNSRAEAEEDLLRKREKDEVSPRYGYRENEKKDFRLHLGFSMTWAQLELYQRRAEQ